MSFLGSCDKSPCGSLITGDVSVCSFLKRSRRHAICVGNRLDIGCIVISVEDHLLVRGNHLRMLLLELLLYIVVDEFQRTLINEAGHSEREHILALVD